MSRAASTGSTGAVIETPLPRDTDIGGPDGADQTAPGTSAQQAEAASGVGAAFAEDLPLAPPHRRRCLLFFPLVTSAYNITLALTVLLTVVMATSWNIISGFTGYVSFGHAGFFGIGSLHAPC